jgi:hypothetical protein
MPATASPRLTTSVIAGHDPNARECDSGHQEDRGEAEPVGMLDADVQKQRPEENVDDRPNQRGEERKPAQSDRELCGGDWLACNGLEGPTS